MKVYRWAWRLVPSVKTSMSYLYVFIGISYDQLWFGVGSAQRSVIEHDSIAKEFVNLTQVLNLPAVAGSECLKCQVWASYFDKAAEQNLTGLATTFTHNISHNINIYILYISNVYPLRCSMKHNALEVFSWEGCWGPLFSISSALKSVHCLVLVFIDSTPKAEWLLGNDALHKHHYLLVVDSGGSRACFFWKLTWHRNPTQGRQPWNVLPKNFWLKPWIRSSLRTRFFGRWAFKSSGDWVCWIIHGHHT